jgi:hypothetical protein
MKNKKTINPAKSKLTILQQVCNLIPGHLAITVARETGVEERARSFDVWSHLTAMVYSQVSHALSLNDVCDGLGMNQAALRAIRGAKVPSRNGLSHANKVRDAACAEQIYWKTLKHLEAKRPGFHWHKTANYAYRFKRPVHLVDATVIPLVANCMDWAKHRRRKAGAKCHLRLDLQSFLPRFVCIDTAAEHEATRAQEVCQGLQDGEIAVFDKGYLDLEHMLQLTQRGVFWVTRAKDNIAYKLIEQRACPAGSKILQDQVVELKYHTPKKTYPEKLRVVVALVEVDGQEREMIFLSNNFSWSAQSVADLYRCRWNIEVFFKTLKQNLQLADFLGYSANAVRWQIWIALLTELLLRFIACTSQWPGAFVRLFTIVRAALWRRWQLLDLLACYGTAGRNVRVRAQPEQAYFAGF